MSQVGMTVERLEVPKGGWAAGHGGYDMESRTPSIEIGERERERESEREKRVIRSSRKIVLGWLGGWVVIHT